MNDKNPEEDGYTVEFHCIGNVFKISAVDTRSLHEVSIIAPSIASEREMAGPVHNKLIRVQSKGGSEPTPLRR